MIVVLTACGKSFKTEADFHKWLHDQENGLVKERSANGFSLKVKYLPGEYLAYLEAGRQKEKTAHYLKDFQNSRTFLFSIDYLSKEDPNANILHYDVSNMPEYDQRVRELNFNMKDYIYIKTSDGKIHRPVLATMENIYHLSSKKDIYLVFADETTQGSLTNSEELDLVFEDGIFDTGINHFVFSKKHLNNLPEFAFIK